MARIAIIGLFLCLALVADSEARRSAAERRAAKQSKRRAASAAMSQVKAQSYRRVTRAGVDTNEKKGEGGGSVFESIKDQAPTPMRLGKATPELLHKLSWTLPSSLKEELVEKMWRLGYDPEFTSEGPMGKLYGGGFNEAPAKPQEEKAPQKKTSLLQKGAARQQKTQTKARTLREKVIEATPEQLLDAEMALKRFVLEEIG